MIITGIVLADDLLELFFGDEFRPAADALRILLVGTFGLAVSSVLADTLRGLGYPIEPAKAELAAFGFNVMLLITLVPTHGIRGAAIASAVSYNIAMVAMAALVWYRINNGSGDVADPRSDGRASGAPNNNEPAEETPRS
jgi:O-antigen/teichoic acid export membrane protein